MIPTVLCAWIAVLMVVGCGQQGQVSPTAMPAATETVSQPPTATPVPSSTPIPDDYFQNPVFEHNFPDPGIIREDGFFYAYATNGAGRNVQAAQSTDLVEWELLTDAMPALASWVRLSRPDVWAPEVIKIEDRYVLYYTARDSESERQCIGVATSDTPDGKFQDPSDEPFICQVDEGGSIDASPFRDDDGTLYLYWKNDGNCCGMPTWIYVQELTPDGLSLVGEPTRLIRNERRWEGPVVEAPTMWNHEDSYYLFYSANVFAGVDYAVGYATCESPAGPCEAASENPILSTVLENPPVIGPGHQTLVRDDTDQTWLVYHAWEVSTSGTKTDRRFLWIDELVWEDGAPEVLGPTTEPQPMPVIQN